MELPAATTLWLSVPWAPLVLAVVGAIASLATPRRSLLVATWVLLFLTLSAIVFAIYAVQAPLLELILSVQGGY